MLGWFAAQAPCRVGLEACGSAHYWARELGKLGHEVRLIAPQFVKPYVKRGKNDANDAEAICEALSRPSMRFVAVKSTAQQALQADGFAGFGAPAVLAAGDGIQRGVDLVEQLLLALQHAQLPVTLFLGAADVGGIAARLLFAQRLEFFLDTRLQLGTLVQKQVAEEGLLLCVHVRLGGLGE